MNTTITKLLIMSLFAFASLHAQTQAQNAGPRIINEQQVKNYWLNTFPQPKTMDRDYHQQKRNYAQLLANIRAGRYDHEAKVKALEWNIAEYQRVRDFDMANESRKTLQMLLQQEEERKRTAAAQASSEALRRMEFQLMQIQLQLSMP